MNDLDIPRAFPQLETEPTKESRNQRYECYITFPGMNDIKSFPGVETRS